MTPTAVIALGVIAWVLTASVLSLFLVRMNRRNRPRTLDTELPVAHPAANPPTANTAPEPAAGTIAGFPARPARFVGRAEAMAAASTALTRATGQTAVVFHGVAGAGKTTCALELTYRHQDAFGTWVFWSAPSDPDQASDALRLLALTLETQLANAGFAMVEQIATQQRWTSFLPTLTTTFTDARLLLVLDNLDALLMPDGHWRDPRWAAFIGALTSQPGPSRVIVTSRIVPAGLNPGTVLIRPVLALSRDESLALVGDLPELCALLRMVALARWVLTLTQGHPQLLELAGAAAADPPRLVYQLTEVEASVNGTALAAFLNQGHTRLDATQLREIVTTWVVIVAGTAPPPARLLLQTLCAMDETDRDTVVIGANWPAVWRRLDRDGEPPSLVSALAPLIAAALVAADPIDDRNGSVRYRIHHGVVEAIRAATPEPVTAAVDAQLAAWWSAVVGGWATELPPEGPDASQFLLRASLAAARYLLRQDDWNAASCLLERALIRDNHAPVTALAIIPLLRQIANATGAAKDLVVLGTALRKLDPGEAEILLNRGYHQATTSGDYPLASTTAGELVSLLRDQGRLSEALTLAGQKIEHTSQAGFGYWTQLSDQGRRLQILHLLGHHEQVLLDMRTLRALMTDLPEEWVDHDRVNPCNVREGVLGIGRASAVALERWDDALELNGEIASTLRRCGATPYASARNRFDDYLPLLRLGRLDDVDQLLRECQDAFDTAGDTAALAMVHAARADLEDQRKNPTDAVEHQRTSLRLRYLHPDPREIAAAHDNLARYLSRAAGNPAEQRAHRLTAALLNHLTGTPLAEECCSDTADPNAPALPPTLPELIRLVDTDDGICLGDLLSSLGPDPATAERALAEVLTTIATATDPSRS